MAILGFYDFLPILPIGLPVTQSNQCLITLHDLINQFDIIL